ncbi:MAG: TetR/AcrR family transcriptional regulator [Ruminococcaceae bacterium]|nr:TetR/AcrR family transcriptional regulator [Oscillospiraceae bacterium]
MEVDTRVKLLIAGINDIEKNGPDKLSIRRVAAECGVSCAAPYKHYKNRNEFIIAIIRYIHDEWKKVTDSIIEKAQEDSLSTRELLTTISIAYVRFLVDHPNYHAVIQMDSKNMTPEQIKEKSQISNASKLLIDKYCTEVNMNEEDKARKTFIVRSIIYGAAMMMLSGELEKSEENYLMVKDCINREFDLG